MTLSELSAAGRSPRLPLELELADAAGSSTLRVDSLLRVLPGRRYVGVGDWRGRKVLAKLLVGRRASRYFLRELQGARSLAEQNLPTPALLASGLIEGEGGWLLFDYLDGAESLGDVWAAVQDQAPVSEPQRAVLGAALEAIAALHGKGLWQADLHLDNLLRHNGQLYLIDGGSVQGQTPGQPLGREQVLANLGVFFAQLPPALEPHIEELLVHYLLANSEHALPLEALLKEVAKVRRWRLRSYLKKVGRDCTLFSVQRGAFGLQALWREREVPLQLLLQAPDSWAEQGQIYKDGGSATVAKVILDGQPLVIKRYNIKNLLHWFRRFWRPSRAWHSWREGHRLQLLGIATPRPLALIERRWCWLRGRAYLITECCDGQDILANFQHYLDDSPPEHQLLALDRLFASLIRERISHGDLKGTNLFWQEQPGGGNWALIDLDAMHQHHSRRAFARGYARDRARFLRNWPADSALHRLLDRRLPQVSDICSED
ncbi:serine/threonine protein kinase [Pseudomonas sp. LS44]|uniref:lipopolysaccharide kinase InaA family protein n=1 Tax=Pseudomonas sp. LS44 TaxID=1357074 RepID=UPI00215A1FFB|nr:lipopolysaccharide kinase InaA family protein [Pseudomonas sp. LS44]UVE18314.1 serine/threonine protein kinase [Pseudomonas sp. LS44]